MLVYIRYKEEVVKHWVGCQWYTRARGNLTGTVSGTPEYHVASRRMRKFWYGGLLLDSRGVDLFLDVSLQTEAVLYVLAQIVGKPGLNPGVLPFTGAFEYKRGVQVVVKGLMESKEAVLVDQRECIA